MDSIEVPLKDQHTALILLLELALQRGSLHEILKMVKLLLDLWSLGQRSRQDNRAGLRDSCAPIIPFLKRLEGKHYNFTEQFLRFHFLTAIAKQSGPSIDSSCWDWDFF